MNMEGNRSWIHCVELAEDVWYGPSADREALREAFKAEAKVLGRQVVVVFVSPDPVFSMLAEPTRHKVFELRIKSNVKLFDTQAVFIGTIDGEEYDKLSELDRRKLVTRVRDTLNQSAKGVAGRYEIRIDRAGKIELAERGRV
jgi:hypothetical protein